MEAWRIGLEGLKMSEIEKGVVKVIRDRKSPFMITVGEFRGYCDEKETVETAYQDFLTGVSSNKTPIFKNSAIAEVIRLLGGISYLKALDLKQLQFIKNDFSRIYGSISGQEHRQLINLKPKMLYYMDVDSDGNEIEVCEVIKPKFDKILFVGYNDQEKLELSSGLEKQELLEPNHKNLKKLGELTKLIGG